MDNVLDLQGMSWWVLVADGALAFSLEFDSDAILKRLSALTYMFAGYAKGFLISRHLRAFLP